MLSDNLECFFALVKYQNYKKAADSLFISQPTLSRRIWDLEAEIGVPLFIRNTRPLELTETGNYFYIQAQKIYTQYADLLQTIQSSLSSSKLSLSLGYMGIYDQEILRDALDVFFNSYPSIYVKIKKITAPRSIHEVQNGTLDGAFVISESFDKTSESIFSYLRIAGNKVYLMVPANSPLAEKDKISFCELKDIDMVSLTNDYSPFLTRNLVHFGMKYGFMPKINQYAEDYQDLQMMVSLGYGVSLIGELSLKDISSNSNIKVIELEEGDVDTDLFFIYLKTNPLIQAFIPCLSNTPSSNLNHNLSEQ